MLRQKRQGKWIYCKRITVGKPSTGSGRLPSAYSLALKSRIAWLSCAYWVAPKRRNIHVGNKKRCTLPSPKHFPAPRLQGKHTSKTCLPHLWGRGTAYTVSQIKGERLNGQARRQLWLTCTSSAGCAQWKGSSSVVGG